MQVFAGKGKVETRDAKNFDWGVLDTETKLVWNVKSNPKRKSGKAYARFEQYLGTETVGEYLENGGTKGDLKYDWSHKFIDFKLDEDESSDGDELIDTSEVVEYDGTEEVTAK